MSQEVAYKMHEDEGSLKAILHGNSRLVRRVHSLQWCVRVGKEG